MADDDQARFARLEATIAGLAAEVEMLRRFRRGAMADTGRCPSCGGGNLLHIGRVKELDRGAVFDLALQQRRPSLLFQESKGQGALEAFACRACRLVEWRAITLDDLEIDGEEVVELTAAPDPEPPQRGPYG